MHSILKIALSLAMALAMGSAHAAVTLGIEGEEATLVGIYVKELATGKVLAENNSKLALLPASVMKSVTAAAALTELGADFTFETPVYLYGRQSPTDDSAWLGNVVIESCADPTIDSELFDKRASLVQEIVQGLRRQGINSISGRIIIEEDLLNDGCIPEWEISDVAWSYGAGLHGFNFRDNVFSLTPATKETRPYVPGLDVTVYQDDDGTDLLRGIYSNHLVVYGSDPTNPKWRVKTSMERPAEVFTGVLAEALRTAGIALLDGEVDDDSSRLPVCVHRSDNCASILRQTLVESHNLFAEGMLRALAPGGTRKEALDKEKSVLRSLQVPTQYNTIVDGSGLARADRLQPVFVSTVLERMAASPIASTYVSCFPRAGENGTVQHLLEKTRLKGQLALKSGSMNGVQCFAGYKLDASGKPTHTVVIMVNSFFCPRAELRGAIEKFLLNTFQTR